MKKETKEIIEGIQMLFVICAIVYMFILFCNFVLSHVGD